jgi:hypothetical protein
MKTNTRIEAGPDADLRLDVEYLEAGDEIQLKEENPMKIKTGIKAGPDAEIVPKS